MSLKLWYSPASPFVRKVMVFAHETGLADSIALVPGDVWAADSEITKDRSPLPLRRTHQPPSRTRSPNCRR
jgi:glutathione S-transferase